MLNLSDPQPDRMLLRVKTAAAMLDVSRAQVYNLVNAGILRSVKIGKSIRIPAAAIRDLAEGVK